jgi:hypothetical protein
MFSKYRPQHTQQKLTLLVIRLANGNWHVVVAQTLLFRMVKTAGLYLVPVKGYSKNGHPYLILKRVLVKENCWENISRCQFAFESRRCIHMHLNELFIFWEEFIL